MNPCTPRIPFAEYFWNEPPFYVSAQFRNGFKRIQPRSLRPLQNCNQRVREKGGLASKTHSIRKNAASCLA